MHEGQCACDTRKSQARAGGFRQKLLGLVPGYRQGRSNDLLNRATGNLLDFRIARPDADARRFRKEDAYVAGLNQLCFALRRSL